MIATATAPRPSIFASRPRLAAQLLRGAGARMVSQRRRGTQRVLAAFSVHGYAAASTALWLYFAWRQLLQWKERMEQAARLRKMQEGLRKVEESIPGLVQQAKELSIGKGSVCINGQCIRGSVSRAVNQQVNPIRQVRPCDHKDRAVEMGSECTLQQHSHLAICSEQQAAAVFRSVAGRPMPDWPLIVLRVLRPQPLTRIASMGGAQ